MSARDFRFDLPIVSTWFALTLAACAHHPAPPPGPPLQTRLPSMTRASRVQRRIPATGSRHGRTYDEQRFSPLKQINADNVGTLGLAWSLDLDTNRGQEATPLVVDGVMYSTSAWSKV